MKFNFKWILPGIIVLILFGAGILWFFPLISDQSLPAQKIDIEIPRGATFAQITDTLIHYGLLTDPNLFRFYGQLTGKDKKIRSGYFSVPAKLAVPDLMDYLLNAKQNVIKVTLIEGWTDEQIASRIANLLRLKKSVFDSLSKDYEFLNKFGLQQSGLTGYLLPDTYTFTYELDEEDIYSFLIRQTQEIFESDTVKNAMAAIGMTRHQILTLASIIEGEALADSERTVISSVFHNRLRKGMRLQACSTIQYILPGPARRLSLKDLGIPSEYNTYLHEGLPPGPINNPGRKSIMAAIFPEKTNYLFFVAKGDGSHRFSATALQHNQAKAAFNEIRKQYYRH